LLSRFQPQVDKLPTLAEGSNTLRFDGTAPQASNARAEVTIMSLGSPFGNRRAGAEIDWTRLDREYDMPRIITQTDGRDNTWAIVHRADTPADAAASPPFLEVEVALVQLGKPEPQAGAAETAAYLDTPILTIGNRSVRFPTRLVEGQRLVCCDRATWRVVNADGTESATGSLADPFPPLSPGANGVKLEFHEQAAPSFRVVVKTAKVYSALP
jgi:hypothetical protein